MVMLGAAARLTGVVSIDAVIAAMVDVNRRAIFVGRLSRDAAWARSAGG